MRLRGASALWLASNDFSDVIALRRYCNEVVVPESDSECLRRKRAWLVSHHEPWITIAPLSLHDYLWSIYQSERPRQFDIVNLDLCTHFHQQTYELLDLVFASKLLSPAGALFLTLAKHSQAQQSSKAQHKVLAVHLDPVVRLIERIATVRGYDLPKPFFLTEYRTASSTGRYHNSMMSFGWNIHYPRKEFTMPNEPLTQREKDAIVSLRAAGVPAVTVAKAFNVTPAQVAAAKAVATMRSKSA